VEDEPYVRAWDLAVLDMVLPQGAGQEIILAIERAPPGLPLIMISGLDIKSSQEGGHLGEGVLERDGVCIHIERAHRAR
jgi:CheY-like chemotaxis protein